MVSFYNNVFKCNILQVIHSNSNLVEYYKPHEELVCSSQVSAFPATDQGSSVLTDLKSYLLFYHSSISPVGNRKIAHCNVFQNYHKLLHSGLHANVPYCDAVTVRTMNVPYCDAVTVRTMNFSCKM